VVALLDLIAVECSSAQTNDIALFRTRTTAPLSPFSCVAPSDLVLCLCALATHRYGRSLHARG